MRLLAIDTALDACSVAILMDGDGSRACLTDTDVIGKGHAEQLIGQIDRLMLKAGLRLDQIDRIAVTVGPGSFTGIRVGIAAARGLALALEIPVVGIGTLEAIAADLVPGIGHNALMVVLDARRDEVYAQAFGRDGAALGDPQVLTVAEAAARAAAQDASLAGSGAGLVAAAMAATGSTPDIVGRMAFPDIATVARLGAEQNASGSPPHPLYIRAADAKLQTGYALPRQPEVAP